jgi:hypothetical protein
VPEKAGNRFRMAVDIIAEDHDVPIVHFKKCLPDVDAMTSYLEAATEPIVVAISAAREFQTDFYGYPA